MKWWAETQTAYHRLHKATDQTLRDIVASMEPEISRSADECCPKCGRRMDFRPEEIERPDDDEAGVGDSADDFRSAQPCDADDSSQKADDDDDFLPVAVP